MSEINSSNQSLNKILDKLGINSAKEKFAPKEAKDQLGQEDFLKLMTTTELQALDIGKIQKVEMKVLLK